MEEFVMYGSGHVPNISWSKYDEHAGKNKMFDLRLTYSKDVTHIGMHYAVTPK